MRQVTGAVITFAFLGVCVVDFLLWSKDFEHATYTISYGLNRYWTAQNTHPAFVAMCAFAFGILANHFFFRWSPGKDER